MLFSGDPKHRVTITNITETETANRRRLLATSINVDFGIRVPKDDTNEKTEKVCSTFVSVSVNIQIMMLLSVLLD